MEELVMAAADLGATSGRVVEGRYDGTALRLGVVSRFSNDAVPLGPHLKWDFPKLLHETALGIARIDKARTAGIDTWGLDFGILDAYGDLSLIPHHYRDGRTASLFEEARGGSRGRALFDATGITLQPFNTSLQLKSLALRRPEVLRRGRTLLMMGDLLGYFLTGRAEAELTNASNSQLLSKDGERWSDEVVRWTGADASLLPPLVRPGSPKGRVLPDTASRYALPPDLTVVNVGSHDTASAVHGCPLEGEGAVYLSSGTWSLMGTLLDEPVLSDAAFERGFTNERSNGGRVRFLKNIMGMWLVEELLRSWQRRGAAVPSYDELYGAAEREAAFGSIIRPNDGAFYSPPDMEAAIVGYLRATSQAVPEHPAGFIRVVLDSLALAYREAVEDIAAVTGRPASSVHIVGGGCRVDLLNRLCADLTALPVSAGPVEGTAAGNLISQLEYLGELRGDDERRDLLHRSFPIRRYEPYSCGLSADRMEEARRRYQALP